MAVPTYDQFIEPILRFLAQQTAPVAAKDVHEAAAKILALTPEQRQETVSSGQLVYKNGSSWKRVGEIARLNLPQATLGVAFRCLGGAWISVTLC